MEAEALVVAQRLQPGELQDRVVVFAEIVDADHMVPVLEQLGDDITRDEAGGSGDD